MGQPHDLLEKLNQGHDEIQAIAQGFFRSVGLSFWPLGIESILPYEAVRAIGKYNTPTAYGIRSLPDDLVMGRGICFLAEYKSVFNPDWGSITIELPFLTSYLSASRYGRADDLLIIHRDSFRDRERGFWISALPKIQEIRIPIRWDGSPKERWFREQAQFLLPGVPVRMKVRSSRNGSDTPYCLINENTAKRLPDWRELIAERLSRGDVEQIAGESPLVALNRRRHLWRVLPLDSCLETLQDAEGKTETILVWIGGTERWPPWQDDQRMVEARRLGLKEAASVYAVQYNGRFAAYQISRANAATTYDSAVRRGRAVVERENGKLEEREFLSWYYELQDKKMPFREPAFDAEGMLNGDAT